MRTLIELPIENDKPDSIERKVKVMYQKCMNEEETEDAIKQLRDIIKTAKAGILYFALYLSVSFLLTAFFCLAVTPFHLSSPYL